MAAFQVTFEIIIESSLADHSGRPFDQQNLPTETFFISTGKVCPGIERGESPHVTF